MYRTSSPKRVFVVGCPRSGTTLLQRILLTDSAIISFPESHFFVNLFKRRSKLRKKFNLASPYSRSGFENFMEEAGHPEMGKSLPRHMLSLRQHTQVFAQTLDEIAKQHHKSIWIEKTPDHVKFIDFIETHIGDALFIHIVRNGPDVVASLYDVTHKYPLEWDGPWDIDQCLRKWIISVTNTYIHRNKPNHLIVNYDSLVQNLTSESQRVGDFMGTNLDVTSLDHRQGSFGKIALQREPWKANSGQAIYQKATDKFSTLFDRPQQTYILETISKAGLLDIEAPQNNQQKNSQQIDLPAIAH
ncbi:sulfotransferase [Leptolyngbya cf. ectocarpi LEGE 11479]|uniref:Sulfotransferase n=1 Tax=Leptolyngbya cf. ectocarpi LEGE 11479 TaxID=1828722 RepID=A0A928X0L2_LEPEC|nr:sulfotransferase [Leptolyngbya ectocarpi]MBE9066257.1 sulfotransferase [Leptolyngbya cf. ectocarpi LEGE 11479]